MATPVSEIPNRSNGERIEATWFNTIKTKLIESGLTKNNIGATTAPAVGDDVDDGYEAGSIWTDVSNDKNYMCVDATSGAAIWKEVVATDSTQTLTNKTMTSPTLNSPSVVTPSRLDVKQDTKSNLETYATTAGDGQLVFATDEQKMYQIIDNALAVVGGGGAGSLNTFYQESFEENDNTIFTTTGSWTKADETTNQLRGDTSVILTQVSGSSGATQTLTTGIVLEDDQKGTLIGFSGRYLADNGSYYKVTLLESSDDITYTEINNVTLENSSNAKSFSVYGTTLAASTHVKYEIEVLTELIADELIIDSLEMMTNPLPIVEFNNMTDWADYTPSVSNVGTSTIEGKFRRVGDTLEGVADLVLNANATGTIEIEIPSSYAIDFSKINSSQDYALVGHANASDAGAHHNGLVLTSNSDPRKLIIVGDDGSNVWNGSTPVTWASGDEITINYRVPIQGWTAKGSGVVTAGQPNEPIIEKFLTGNTTSVGDMADLTITSLTIGDWYELTGQISFYSANTSDCQVQYRSASGGAGDVYGRSRFDPEIGSGNTEDVRSLAFKFQATSTDLYVRMTSGDGNNLVRGDGTADQTFIQVEAINKPTAVISPFRTEPVCAGASSNNGQTVADGGVIIYEDELYDTNTAYDTTTGVFTVPTGQGGYYRASASIRRNAVGPVRIVIQKNSNNYARFYNSDSSIDSTVSGSCSMNLTAGDTVRVIQDIGSSITIRSTAEDNTFFIEKIN